MENDFNKTKSKALTSLMWSFMEKFGAQCVTFVVSIVLARLLEPDAYGVLGIVVVFMEILNVFVDSGLGNALVQKKDADAVDFSSVFFFNILMCTALYLLLFAAAPFIADYFRMPKLSAVIRVMGLSLIFSGINNVQKAFVARQLKFKRFFFATLGGTLGAAVVGILLAVKGCGVWALVGQSLFSSFANTVILWFTVKWRPIWSFSAKRFKGLFVYGWKLLVSSIIDTIYNNLRQLIIGKMYSAESLAFYNRGYMIPNTFVGSINSSIDSVLLPVMSSAQESAETVKAMTRRSVRVSSYVMWPIMMGIAACSEAIISVLLTDKWLPSVPFVMIFCVSYAFQPLETANLNAYKHFINSGVGIRQICDIAQWSKHYALDWRRIYDVMRSVHGECFAAAVFDAGERYFGMEYPPFFERSDCTALINDALDGGIYGASDMSRKHSGSMTLEAVDASEKGKTGRPLLRTLFPNRSVMEASYPWVKKSAALLPAAWTARIAKYAVSRGTDSSAAESVRIGNERIELMKYYKII